MKLTKEQVYEIKMCKVEKGKFDLISEKVVQYSQIC